MVSVRNESYDIDSEKYEDTCITDAKLEEKTITDQVNNEKSEMTRVVGTDGEFFAYSDHLYSAENGRIEEDSAKILRGISEVESKLEDGKGESLEDRCLTGAAAALTP